jgi:hypothetical protein
MVAVFWSLERIHMIGGLPTGERFNSQHFGQNGLYGRDASLHPEGMAKPILIHMDISSRHRSKETLSYMKALIFVRYHTLHSHRT